MTKLTTIEGLIYSLLPLKFHMPHSISLIHLGGDVVAYISQMGKQNYINITTEKNTPLRI